MLRVYSSDDKKYNWTFDTATGVFRRWGSTYDDDPQSSPDGPELLDIELSTICHGIEHPCPWCYKSNTGSGINMTLNAYKEIFQKIPRNLMQVAFGIGDIDANPDLWAIMEYTRENGVIPNITINGARMTPELYDRLARVCGAVAVSHYFDGSVCAEAVHQLGRRVGLPGNTLRQVNIHKLLAQETVSECGRLMLEAKLHRQYQKLNAIVFLLLKPKGARNRLHRITDTNVYRDLVKLSNQLGIQIGMDSCSAPAVLRSAEELGISPSSIEPCESGLFSLYINAEGRAFPCSFTEGTLGWEAGIDMTQVQNFMQDVWFGAPLSDWRRNLLQTTTNCDCKFAKTCRACPAYDITPCKPH